MLQETNFLSSFLFHVAGFSGFKGYTKERKKTKNYGERAREEHAIFICIKKMGKTPLPTITLKKRRREEKHALGWGEGNFS